MGHVLPFATSGLSLLDSCHYSMEEITYHANPVYLLQPTGSTIR